MTRTFAAQAVSFSLALLVTVGTLVGLNALAGSEQGAAQQIAAARAAQA